MEAFRSERKAQKNLRNAAKDIERGAERCHLLLLYEAAFSAPAKLLFDTHGDIFARGWITMRV
ncbi:hypothetical protein ASE23_00605 [Rhizobium sp. Root73]|nr:hypothetical protein ASC96_03700 [Rhizobium sp. Root1204]KQY17201.1 hypothetical protein ASD36_00610 [Rhizobium sp. Root1334]KRC13094.1 hypothetical protein ASE23_00605 [Rhizobium sp. Root73]